MRCSSSNSGFVCRESIPSVLAGVPVDVTGIYHRAPRAPHTVASQCFRAQAFMGDIRCAHGSREDFELPEYVRSGFHGYVNILASTALKELNTGTQAMFCGKNNLYRQLKKMRTQLVQPKDM